MLCLYEDFILNIETSETSSLCIGRAMKLSRSEQKNWVKLDLEGCLLLHYKWVWGMAALQARVHEHQLWRKFTSCFYFTPAWRISIFPIFFPNFFTIGRVFSSNSVTFSCWVSTTVCNFQCEHKTREKLW